jgi:hypothetical protein
VHRHFTEQEQFFVVQASGCMELAADIAERHPIKGADAVHIASALIARDSAAVPERFYFVSEDIGQARVAEAEGLQVLRQLRRQPGTASVPDRTNAARLGRRAALCVLQTGGTRSHIGRGEHACAASGGRGGALARAQVNRVGRIVPLPFPKG